MSLKIDNVTVCEPVTKLVDTLQGKGYTLEKSRVSDYHFNEVYFLLQSAMYDIDLSDIKIDNIERHSDNLFNCKCHWSIVEIKNKTI